MYVRDAVFKGRKGEIPICHAKPRRVIHLVGSLWLTTVRMDSQST